MANWVLWRTQTQLLIDGIEIMGAPSQNAV